MYCRAFSKQVSWTWLIASRAQAKNLFWRYLVPPVPAPGVSLSLAAGVSPFIRGWPSSDRILSLCRTRAAFNQFGPFPLRNTHVLTQILVVASYPPFSRNAVLFGGCIFRLQILEPEPVAEDFMTSPVLTCTPNATISQVTNSERIVECRWCSVQFFGGKRES